MSKEFKSFFTILVIAILLGVGFNIASSKITEIRHLNSVHIQGDNDSFYTDLNINSVDLGQALVDTGSSDISISEQAADLAHLDWRNTPSETYVIADESRTTCHLVNTTVKVGALIKQAGVSVCPKGDALLGMTFLKQIKVHLENDSMTLE